MKLVLDTNVFISAFFWGGNPRKIMTRIIEGKDYLFSSDAIIGEVAKVMSRPKFGASPQIVLQFTESIRNLAVMVPLMGIVNGVCRDKDDDKILECAILCQADYIITGDDDLLSLANFKGTEIITANQYLNAN
jgi:putative PIN family toxin of toxin-antitoxin system